MPLKSKAQARFLFANHPKIAKEFAAKTPSIKALPQHVKNSQPPGPEESPEHEAAESPAFEKKEHKQPKLKVRSLFAKK